MSQPLPTRSEHLVPAERRRQIFELLHERGSIAVADIEELFQGLDHDGPPRPDPAGRGGTARRTHGGAVLPELTAFEDSFDSRLMQEVDEKIRLARHVAADVAPNEAVFIDSSSTAHYVLRALLDARTPVTLVTNSLPAMALVAAADAPRSS